jgi:hypothetical protein
MYFIRDNADPQTQIMNDKLLKQRTVFSTRRMTKDDNNIHPHNF